MAAKGILFPHLWYGGMISTTPEVIWEMSAKKANQTKKIHRPKLRSGAVKALGAYRYSRIGIGSTQSRHMKTRRKLVGV